MTMVKGSFVAVSKSKPVGCDGKFTATLEYVGAATGTVRLMRSLDQGATWHLMKEYTAAIADIGEEAASGAQYLFDCTAVTGTINYWLGT